MYQTNHRYRSLTIWNTVSKIQHKHYTPCLSHSQGFIIFTSQVQKILLFFFLLSLAKNICQGLHALTTNIRQLLNVAKSFKALRVNATCQTVLKENTRGELQFFTVGRCCKQSADPWVKWAIPTASRTSMEYLCDLTPTKIPWTEWMTTWICNTSANDNIRRGKQNAFGFKATTFEKPGRKITFAHEPCNATQSDNKIYIFKESVKAYGEDKHRRSFCMFCKYLVNNTATSLSSGEQSWTKVGTKNRDVKVR